MIKYSEETQPRLTVCAELSTTEGADERWRSLPDCKRAETRERIRHAKI